MTKLHGVVCYWVFTNKNWHFAESFSIDDNGYSLTIPSTGGDDRHEWLKWTNSKVYINEVDYDWQPIMGRAVTLWTVESGVKLIDFHPPEWIDWLSPSFYEKLCNLHNWFAMLEGGYLLYTKTADEARKYL